MLDDTALEYLARLSDENCKTAKAFLLDYAADLMASGEPLGGLLNSMVISFIRDTTRHPINYKSVRRVAIALHTRDMVAHGYGKHREPEGAYYLIGEAYGINPKTIERYYKKYGNF